MAYPEEWSYSSLSLASYPFTELVSFYVRPSDADKLLFESAYADIIEYGISPI
jgi:hypothetical protein